MANHMWSVLVIAASLALTGATSESAAQATPWERLGGPPGGLGYDIRYNFDDPNIWYVTDAHAGVHISFDNGLTWEPVTTGITKQSGPAGDWRPIFCLTVDENDADIVWAGTDETGRIYRSVDRGLTWERRDNGIVIEHDHLTFRGFTIEPGNSDVVYAMAEILDVAAGGAAIWSNGVGGVVYRTDDGGANWTKIWDGGIPSSLARYMWLDPADLGHAFVSTGIFDRGAVGEGDPVTDVEPWGGLGVLELTYNSGTTSWDVDIQDESNGLRMLYLGSLTMHPTDSQTLLAAAGHEFGQAATAHWQALGDSPAGIFRTTNAGELWTQVYKPLDWVGEEFSSVEFCPNHPSIAYAGSGSAIYRSTTAGASWQKVAGESGPWGPPGVAAGWPIDMQCDPRDPNRVLANNYRGGAFLSEDGGSTWANVSTGYTGAQAWNVVVDRTSGLRVYALARSGPWRSDDAGRTWSGIRYPPAGIIGQEWATLAGDPTDGRHLFLSDLDAPVILESDDGGGSWTLATTPSFSGSIAVFEFAPSNSMVVYAGTASPPCVHDRVMCPDASASGVLASTDGGANWSLAVDADFAAAGVVDLAVDSTDAYSVWAATLDGGLWHTDDGGVDWWQVPITGLTSPRVMAIAVDPEDPDRILAGVQLDGAYASSNGGVSWTPVNTGLEPNGSIHAIEFDPSDFTVVYLADQTSGVYRSSDSGTTWLKISLGLEERAARSLAITEDGNHVFAGTNGNGAYRLDVDGNPPGSAIFSDGFESGGTGAWS